VLELKADGVFVEGDGATGLPGEDNTIEISQAAVASTSQFSPDGLAYPGAPPAVSALEDVSFAFQQIRWRTRMGQSRPRTT
jgi:hypothetical protein